MKSIHMTGKILMIMLMFVFACTPKNDPQKIKAEIEKHKAEIAELNSKVKDLKEILGDSLNNDLKHNILVTTSELKPTDFNHFIEVKGIVEAVEDAFISPQMSGQIKAIYVNEGDRVKKGDLLVSLNANVTDKGIEEIKTALELATTTYLKQKELWEQKIGSEIQYLQAKNAKESLEGKLETLKAQKEMSMIFAPFDGIVDRIYQKVGELGTPGMRIMQLVNLNDLYINAAISEDYLAAIHEGEMVEISFPSYPEINMEAKIHRTGNVINNQNRTFEIKLKIKNTDEKLKPNMLSILKINDFSAKNALVVPSIIIKQDIKGKYIYKAIKNADGKLNATKVYMETGMSYNGNTMLLSGVSEGDNIIVEGYNIVTDGSDIRLK